MTSSTLYEMRLYRVGDGRMTDELVRGLDCVLTEPEGGTGLFARHGIPAPLGIWRMLSGAHLPGVVFLYRWGSVAERARAFEAFYEDRDWQALRATSNGGTEIVDRIDDLLFRGPPPGPLPPGALYEFVRGESGPGAVAIGPLRPLCGRSALPLTVLAHDGAAPAIEVGGESSRTLGRLVPVEART